MLPGHFSLVIQPMRDRPTRLSICHNVVRERHTRFVGNVDVNDMDVLLERILDAIKEYTQEYEQGKYYRHRVHVIGLTGQSCYYDNKQPNQLPRIQIGLKCCEMTIRKNLGSYSTPREKASLIRLAKSLRKSFIEDMIKQSEISESEALKLHQNNPLLEV